MDFTKREILEMKLRLIALAIISGPLIAGFHVCDQQTQSARGGDEPEQLIQNFTLGEIHQRYFPGSGYSFVYYGLERGFRSALAGHRSRPLFACDSDNSTMRMPVIR